MGSVWAKSRVTEGTLGLQTADTKAQAQALPNSVAKTIPPKNVCMDGALSAPLPLRYGEFLSMDGLLHHKRTRYADMHSAVKITTIKYWLIASHEAFFFMTASRKSLRPNKPDHLTVIVSQRFLPTSDIGGIFFRHSYFVVVILIVALNPKPSLKQDLCYGPSKTPDPLAASPRIFKADHDVWNRQETRWGSKPARRPNKFLRDCHKTGLVGAESTTMMYAKARFFLGPSGWTHRLPPKLNSTTTLCLGCV